MEAIAPSGVVAAPIQPPVKVSREAKATTVEVGDNRVGDAVAGVDIDEAQADSTQSRRRVVMMRMDVSICE